MSEQPRLAVHVGRQVPELLLQLLTATTPWCVPVAVSEQELLPDGVVAHLYTSEVLPSRPVTPFAVWRLGSTGSPRGAAAVLAAAGDPLPGDLVVTPLQVPEGARPVLPFTRARYRELRGLPPRTVAIAEGEETSWADGDGQPHSVPSSRWYPLAALAAAVVATGEHVWPALAWAAPVVTDPASARHWGLTGGADVLVADSPAARRALAEGLADDQARAAVLARRGWQAAQHRTLGGAAQHLCGQLGLTARHDLVAEAGLTTALDRLRTPRQAFIRRRARAAAAALPGAVTHGWRPPERILDAHT